MDANVLFGLAALVTAIATLLGVFLQNRRMNTRIDGSATRNEVDVLRDEVKDLEKRIDNINKAHDEEVGALKKRVVDLENEYRRERENNLTLMDYISNLRKLLISAGMNVPEMPKLR